MQRCADESDEKIRQRHLVVRWFANRWNKNDFFKGNMSKNFSCFQIKELHSLTTENDQRKKAWLRNDTQKSKKEKSVNNPDADDRQTHLLKSEDFNTQKEGSIRTRCRQLHKPNSTCRNEWRFNETLTTFRFSWFFFSLHFGRRVVRESNTT